MKLRNKEWEKDEQDRRTTKRVEHLETEVELLKELAKLQNKCPERVMPIYPQTPLQPYYSKEPTLEPPYKFTCGGEK